MLPSQVSRRRFIASTSVIAAAAAIPAGTYLSSGKTPISSLVSAERLAEGGIEQNALVLDGARMDRLNAMAARLPAGAHKVILRLDSADEQLLDIAAQQVGVNIRRGPSLADGSGVRAFIIPQKRISA